MADVRSDTEESDVDEPLYEKLKGTTSPQHTQSTDVHQTNRGKQKA